MFAVTFILFMSLFTSPFLLFGAERLTEVNREDSYESRNLGAQGVIEGQGFELRKICKEDGGCYGTMLLKLFFPPCDDVSDEFYKQCRKCVEIFHKDLSSSDKGEILCYCIWEKGLLTGTVIIEMNKYQESELRFCRRNDKLNFSISDILSKVLWLTIDKFFEIHPEIDQILTSVCRSDLINIGFLQKIGFDFLSSEQNLEAEIWPLVLTREKFAKQKQIFV